jgi:hypothetical protein
MTDDGSCSAVGFGTQQILVLRNLFAPPVTIEEAIQAECRLPNFPGLFTNPRFQNIRD